MTKLQKSKKGFTLTELAIVIAVIAILIAVLVPTFTSLINKANESADKQLVKNLNTAITIDDPENETQVVSEALEIAQNNGYTLSKISPTSDGYDIVWDEVSNRFVLMNDTEVVYYDSSTDTTNMELWYITNSGSILNNGKNYYYSADSGIAGEVTVYGGADLSALTGVTKVTLDASSASQSTVITVVVPETALAVSNTNSATIKVYGSATTISGTYGMYSLHVYGEVTGKIDLSEGKVVAETGSDIASIIITASDISKVAIEAKSSDSIKSVGATNDTVATALSSSSQISGVSSSAVVTTAVSNAFAGGTGTEESPYQISSVSEWLSICTLDSYTTETSELILSKKYWKITADLDFSEVTYSGTGDYSYFTTNLYGYIDFDYHTITLNDDYTPGDNEAYGLFLEMFGGSISNLTLESCGANMLVCYIYMYYGDVTISNVTVNGNLTVTGNNTTAFVGYVVGYGNNYVLTLKNCTNNAQIVSSADSGAGIFVGKVVEWNSKFPHNDVTWLHENHINNSSSSNSEVTQSTENIPYGYAYIVFDTCINYGTLIHSKGYAGMLLANGSTFTHETLDKITVKNCVNYGTIIAPDTDKNGDSNSSFSTNLLCGCGAGSITITDISTYISGTINQYSSNLTNSGGTCGTGTVSSLTTTSSNTFDLSGISAYSYTYTVTLRLEYYTTDSTEEGATAWGSYGITFKISSSNTTIYSYNWISYWDLTDSEKSTVDGESATSVTIGDKTVKTITRDSVTYLVIDSSLIGDTTGYSYISYNTGVGISGTLLAYNQDGSLAGYYSYSYSG